ncbi:MAG: nucleotidyltransferase domain-containing protein [Deltaproteobacteria bacterium]|nr:nucleotidyltransferase domain-containing protein [Deltaproteobacteria bacterium]
MVPHVETMRTVARRYADTVRREMANVDRIVLFGSVAKGSARKVSDTDIAVFFSDLGDRDEFDVNVELILLTYGFKAGIEPLVFTVSDIDDDNPFVKEILKTGLEI